MAERIRETPVYLQLARKSADWRANARADLRIISATAGPPISREAGSVLVSLLVRLPDAAFDEPVISAVVDVPADAVGDVFPTVDVEVQRG